MFNKDLDKDVYRILTQMLVIDPRAECYSVNSNNCALYFPTPIDEGDIKEGYKYSYYKINGKLYDSIGTSKIDYWLKQMAGNIQMKLF